jgi:hypothetical protein
MNLAEFLGTLYQDTYCNNMQLVSGKTLLSKFGHTFPKFTLAINNRNLTHLFSGQSCIMVVVGIN